MSIPGYILNSICYSPFGTVLYGRKWSADSYRYGFNGKEKDTEGSGGGNQTYDYGFRIYNPALAKFLSVDPLSSTYPWYTPYQFAGNKPIVALDLDGLEELDFKKFAEAMIKGAALIDLTKLPFPKVSNNWHQASDYENNEFWEVERGGKSLILREGVSPSVAVQHIFDNPNLYEAECGTYVQLVKLYGIKEALGNEEFDVYMKSFGGGVRLSNHESTGITTLKYYALIDGKWWAGNEEAPNFNPMNKINECVIGSEMNLQTPILKKLGSAYGNENIVKVGENKYLAQGLTVGPAPFKQIVKALVDQALKAQDEAIKKGKLDKSDRQSRREIKKSIFVKEIIESTVTEKADQKSQ